MVSKALFLKLLLIACAGGMLIGHYLIHQFSIPAETALRLSEGTMMADGALPYLDFLDNATPFYLYLNMVPVLISRIVFMHPIVITNLFAALFFMLSGGALVLLSEVAPARRNPLNAPIWAILVAFVFVTLLQPVHFAQANQIFFLALCPYIVCRSCTARALRVPQRLAIATSAGLCFAAMIDPIYWLFIVALELCILIGFFPFFNRHFVLRRYLGVELKALALLLLVAQVIWLLLPRSSAYQYLSVIIRLNYFSFCDTLKALNFYDSASDTRPFIYLAVFLLIVSLPQARLSILVRLFGIASFLGLGLMIIQGAALAYQTYLFVGFATMAFAAALIRQPIPHQLLLQPRLLPKLPWPVFSVRGQMYLPVLVSTVVVFALGLYLLELAFLNRAHRFDLSMLRYYGLADKRDLGILSETVEEFSTVGDPVAILGLGVRPAYPVITQLRRKPGLSLTWGFPLDTLHTLEDPYRANDMAPLKEFRKQMYKKLISQLSAENTAPILLLIDGDQVRQLLKEQGAYTVIDGHYDFLGGVSLLDPGDKEGHPPLEYVGYKSGFAIYRPK